MKLVVFGLSVSSSWGNGHATLWRGLIRALTGLGHRVVFFERDMPYYAEHRDLFELPGGGLVLYPEWEEARRRAQRELAEADVGIVTSYCPDAIAASETVLSSPARVRCFYDLDTGVTIGRLQAGRAPEYIPQRGLGDFDLVLSYTGGQALAQLKTRLGARHVAPLYGSVDPQTHHPAPPEERFRADLSYLCTYAADRQASLEDLFIEPARRRPDLRFVIGGSQYPGDFPWSENIFFIPHVPPAEHPAFYCSSRLTLSVTRAAMAAMGYCPSGRLFEAAACGAPILSDDWDGLDYFFEPGVEIQIARTTGHVMDALAKSPEDLARIGRAGRERVLASHTAERRALELENILEAAISLPVETAGNAEC
ncbi:MAG: glycosyltransferase [Acidobacteriia bacterium]|nr:glycosyltransferase [Terriglobia bacterium]